MSAVRALNPKAESANASDCLALNIEAARGLQNVIRSNLGPKGTLKMLVSGSGEIKITKDGCVLLNEMQLQHPTASMMAKAATAQDDVTGDGTTSNVLLAAELLKQAEQQVEEGLHPRILHEGYNLARVKLMEILDSVKVAVDKSKLRETLIEVARTSLRTKLHQGMADMLTEQVVDAVLAIKPKTGPADLHMVEVMDMKHRTDMDTSLIKGIVLDHGARHPDMKKRIENAYILTCNVSLEYEKSEINSGFFYKSAVDRERLVQAERAFTDARVQKIIDLKRKVCGPGRDTEKGFVVINQKGIDPPSLEMLAREGIVALRRAKRRNMERLPLACGGFALNSLDDLNEHALGFAGLVYEYVLGEEKYTFVEKCRSPQSVTLLVRGPNKHTIVQIKDAIHDGLRAVNNVLVDGYVVPGAGAFEVAAHHALQAYQAQVTGRAKLGVDAFARALLIIPKVLAHNSGHDPQECIVRLMEEYARNGQKPVGIDLNTGQPMLPLDVGVVDNYCVKLQMLDACAVITGNLLLVDEMLRAGSLSTKGD